MASKLCGEGELKTTFMKFFKISGVSLVAIAMLTLGTMSFTNSENEIVAETIEMEAPPVFTCCPAYWALAYLAPNDPAKFYDNNEDGLICWKFSAIGTGTPLGQGNDPLFFQSNVKDNNSRCAYY